MQKTLAVIFLAGLLGSTGAAIASSMSESETIDNLIKAQESSSDAKAMKELQIMQKHNATETVEYKQFIKELEPIVNDSPTTAERMTPDAAKAYKAAMESKKQKDVAKNATIELTDAIINNAFGNSTAKEYVDEFVNLNSDKDEYYQKNILIFISSSMPEGLIRNLLDSVGHSERVAFVIRGLIDDDISKIMPTQKWIQSFLCPGGDAAERCFRTPVDINPVLFERFKIDRVPALVYLPNPDETTVSCDPKDVSTDDFFVYYGDFSVDYMLGKIQDKRPEDAQLQKIRKSLFNDGFYSK